MNPVEELEYDSAANLITQLKDGYAALMAEQSQVITACDRAHIETEVALIKDQSNLGQTETSAALTFKTKFKASLQEQIDKVLAVQGKIQNIIS